MATTQINPFGLESQYSQSSLTKIDSQITQRSTSSQNSQTTQQSQTISKRFLLPPRKDYNQQYFNVYRSRLETSRIFFQKQIQAVLDYDYENSTTSNPLGPIPIWTNLPDAKPNQKCVVIGVSYKNMDKKPSVLDDIGYRHQKSDNSKWKLHPDRKMTKMLSTVQTSKSTTTTTTTTTPTTDNNNNNSSNNSMSDTPSSSFNSSITRTNTATFNDNTEIDLTIYNDVNYCTESDVLHLEDTNGRVPLIFSPSSRLYTCTNDSLLSEESKALLQTSPFEYLNRPITAHHFVSGLIMGVEGELCESTGEFIVSRVFLPSFHFTPIPTPNSSNFIPPISSPNTHKLTMTDDDEISFSQDVSSTTSTTTTTTTTNYLQQQPNDTYIAFISGINLALLQSPNETSKLLRLSISLLTDFLTGTISNNQHETTTFLPKITDCIIAGDLIGSTPFDTPLPTVQKGKKSVVQYTQDKQQTQVPTVIQGDLFLTKLCSSMNVYLLPGSHDPTNYSIPQQPFNPCLFPSASTYTNFYGVSNPAQLTIGDIDIIGTDGMNITNISKHSSHSVLSSLILMTQSQHLAPTAPDTLPLYPYQHEDPLSFCPHADVKTQSTFKQPNIIFSGNAPHFQNVRMKCSTTAIFTPKQVEKFTHEIDLLTIPNFSTTSSFVIMNTRTKQCIPIYLTDDINMIDNVQVMLQKMNLATGEDDHHASIDFGEDEEGGDGGE